MKEMEDGSKAVGLFNLFPWRKTIKITWEELGISGAHQVRDLWRQQDLGSFTKEFSAKVNSHGVILVRIVPKT
jgi:alpha-galactosidase